MRNIINNLVNVALVVSIILMISTVGFTIGRNMGNNDRLQQLNKEFVFIYPHQSELPEGVNLCADVIIPGLVRDTVWLMPDHESAGY